LLGTPCARLAQFAHPRTLLSQAGSVVSEQWIASVGEGTYSAFGCGLREGFLVSQVIPSGAAFVSGTGQAWRRLARRLTRTELLQSHVVVFMVGLPAAGKSRQIDMRYRSRNIPLTVIDLDAEMVAHPQFDPVDPDSVYRLDEAWGWANARVEAKFQASLTNKSYARVIVDGTGTNIERQVRRMREAREAGWYVKVLYVRVPIKTAIQRAMLRTRRVSPERIAMYQAKISKALVIAAKHADEVETVDSSYDLQQQVMLFQSDVSLIAGI